MIDLVCYDLARTLRLLHMQAAGDVRKNRKSDT